MVDEKNECKSPNDDARLQKVDEEWKDLSKEFQELEGIHKLYRSKVDEVISLQKKCFGGIKHQKYRIKDISGSLASMENAPSEEKGRLEKEFFQRKMQISQMEGYLPRESGPYLKLILGNLNVSILDKEGKYQYKDQYEQFKLTIMVVGSLLAATSLCLDYRILDICLMFLVVWYYCTLTIRESILRVNGSGIAGWWRAHHFIATVAGGIQLIWPDGYCFRSFRLQYLWFSIYIGVVSYLQFHYQRGCLYRLRCLGIHDNDMDITVDGFQSWMFKGLSFLLPFLAFGYLWQLYHAYTLYVLSLCEDAEWQVFVLSMLFVILGVGNIITTTLTVTNKIQNRQLSRWRLGFAYLHKYIPTANSREALSTTETSENNNVKTVSSIESAEDNPAELDDCQDLSGIATSTHATDSLDNNLYQVDTNGLEVSLNYKKDL